MDSNTINEARTFLRNFRSVLSFADMVDQIGTWESALTEIKISVKDVQADAEKQKAALAELKKEKDAAVKEIAALKHKAKEIEGAAAERAAAILAKAEADASAARTIAGNALKAEEQKLAEARQEVGRLAAQKDAALAEFETTQKEHAAFKERILNG